MPEFQAIINKAKREIPGYDAIAGTNMLSVDGFVQFGPASQDIDERGTSTQAGIGIGLFKAPRGVKRDVPQGGVRGFMEMPLAVPEFHEIMMTNTIVSSQCRILLSGSYRPVDPKPQPGCRYRTHSWYARARELRPGQV
jgi:hypothetical protein